MTPCNFKNVSTKLLMDLLEVNEASDGGAISDTKTEMSIIQQLYRRCNTSLPKSDIKAMAEKSINKEYIDRLVSSRKAGAK